MLSSLNPAKALGLVAMGGYCALMYTACKVVDATMTTAPHHPLIQPHAYLVNNAEVCRALGKLIEALEIANCRKAFINKTFKRLCENWEALCTFELITNTKVPLDVNDSFYVHSLIEANNAIMTTILEAPIAHAGVCESICDAVQELDGLQSNVQRNIELHRRIHST